MLEFISERIDDYMKTTYALEVAGLKRELQLFPINDKLQIAAFIMFGDVELTCKCAEELLKIAPEHDIMITAEAKSIPLIYEMARQSGENNYIIARNMKNPLEVCVNSITTQHQQHLYIGEDEVNMIKGKKILLVDDVISTGESLSALVDLVEKAGGNIVGKMAVLAEGDAIERKDITVLKPLPLFDAEGNPLA